MAKPKQRRPNGRDTRTPTSLKIDTSSTAGGPQKSGGTIESSLSNDGDEFEPLPRSAPPFDWMHAAKIIGAGLGVAVISLTVVVAAVSMTKDLEAIGSDVDGMVDKVDVLTNKATVIEARLDGVQSSINEVRRDVRDSQPARVESPRSNSDAASQ